MLTKSFKRKSIAMALAVALILALCVTLLVACGDKDNNSNNNNNQVPTPEEHEHNFDLYPYMPADCVTDGHIAYLYCVGCGKYFDENENEIEYADVVLPATGEHELSDWIEERSATCKQRAKHYKMCYVCEQRIVDEEYGNLLEHVERTYPIVADVEPTCLTAGVGHTVCDLCGDTMTKNIPIDALGHEFDWESTHYYNEPTCTEDGNNLYYHCDVCNKNFASNDRLCDEEMSQEDIVIEKLGHDFDNDGKWHTDDASHWHYCTRCYQNIDEANHTDSESCDVCNWVKVYFNTQYFSFTDADRHNHSGLKITEYTGNDANVEIPAEVDGESVIAIGEAFYGRTDIETVTLPASILYIGSNAFARSTLTSINLPEGLLKIEGNAFLNCYDLLEITFPESLREIGSSIFSNYMSNETFALKTINWNVKNCSQGSLFYDEKNLAANLTDINIGDNVEFITPIFRGDNVTLAPKINVSSFKEWCDIDFDFDFFNPLYTCKGDLYAGGEKVDFENLFIPDGITYIGERSFYKIGGGKTIKTISLPATLKSVGVDAFRGNEAIEGVAFRGALKDWCEMDFAYQEMGTHDGWSNPLYYLHAALTIGGNAVTGELTIPEGTTKISNAAFYNQPIECVNIPSSVKKIENSAFSGTSITEVHFGGDLKEWCDIDFQYNSTPFVGEDDPTFYAQINGEEREVKGELTLPAGATQIPQYAFYRVKGLTKLNMNTDGALKEIKEYAFYQSGITTVTLPDSVEKVEPWTFDKCADLEYVTIGKGLTSYGGTFMDCPKLISFEVDVQNTALESKSGVLYRRYQNGELVVENVPYQLSGPIIIPEGVKKLNSSSNENSYRTFENRTKITSVLLPKSLEELSYLDYSSGDLQLHRCNVFYGCTSLTNITMNSDDDSEENEYFKSYKGVLYFKSTKAVCAIPLAIETVEIMEGCRELDRYDFGEWDVANDLYRRLELVGQYENLTTIILSQTVDHVDYFNFYECEALEKILVGVDNTPGMSGYFKSQDGILYRMYDSENVKWTLHAIPRNLSGDVTVLDGIERLEMDREVTSYDVVEPMNFRFRENLHSITLPKSMVTIPAEVLADNPFYGCTSLEAIIFEDGGNDVYATEGGILYVKAGDALKIHIVPEGIVNATIPTTCTTVERFKNLTKLESVTLHEGITNLAQDAFDGCTSLVNINMSGAGENEVYKAEDGILYAKDGEELDYYLVPTGIKGQVTLKEGITKVAAGAFKGRTSMTSLIIPDSVTEIGDSAFEGCTGLETITVGAGVTTVGRSAFKGCTSLTTVYWNAVNCETTALDLSGNYHGIFYDCSKLDTVVFGEDVQIVPANFFYEVQTLTELTINVPTIGQSAFERCDIGTLTIGEKVTSIGGDAFYGNYNLHTVNYLAINCTDACGSGMFGGCPALTAESFNFAPSMTTLPAIFKNCDLTEYTVPAQFTAIANDAFRGNQKLQTIDFGKVTTIGDDAFYGCLKLQTVTLGDDVTTIGYEAFAYCEELATVTIGKGLKTMGGYAFEECDNLATLYFNATDCDALDTQMYYPFLHSDNLSNLVFGEDVQSVPAYMFSFLKGLTTLEINVPFIGTRAFYSAGIETLTIGEDVKTIEREAFYKNASLATVYWNAINCTKAGWEMSSQWLGGAVFVECPSLTTFTFGDKVENIPDRILYSQNNVTTDVSINEITVPAGVKNLGSGAFGYCPITSFTFLATNCADAEHSGSMLWGCNKLTSITIGDEVTRIPANLFDGVTYRGYIVIPDSVQEIGAAAFDRVAYFDIVLGSGVQRLAKGWYSKYPSSSVTGGNIYYNGEKSGIDGIEFEDTADKTTLLGKCYYFSAESNTDGKHWHWQGNDPSTGIPELWA